MLLVREIAKKTNNCIPIWSPIKSDRINALRKQYDAFLEEDKRRKERNDYILGRLDKMRYCTAVVPLRPKPSIYASHTDILNTPQRQPDIYSTITHPSRNFSLDVPGKHADETLLQEISKKYILIPKIRSTLDVINVQPIKTTVEDPSDWKSKYNILDQLKRDEIESDITYTRTEYKDNEKLNTHDVPLHNENYDVKVHDHKVDSSTEQKKYEMPEKDKNYFYEVQSPTNTHIEIDQQEVSDNSEIVRNRRDEMIPEQETKANAKIEHNLPEQEIEYENTVQMVSPENDVSIIQPDSDSHINTTEHTEIDYNNETNISSDYPAQDEPTTYDNQYLPIDKDEPTTYDNQYIPIDKDEPTTYDNQYVPMDKDEPTTYDNQYVPIDEDKDAINDTEKINSHDENKTHATEVISAKDHTAEINPVQGSPEAQENQYPIETINVQDFTPRSEVPLEENVNINPIYPTDPNYQYDPNTQVVADNPMDTSGIEAFEAEQNEMFYSEQQHENYAYNPEHYEDVKQNEEYAPNSEAAYYDGTQLQEQPTGELVNEHEESNQRYDPNYEQQYGGYMEEYKQEGYENQEYEQQQQQYETESVEPTQQGIEQLHLENEQYDTKEQLEQELNKEEGYVAQNPS